MSSLTTATDLITRLRARHEGHDGPLGAAHWRLVDDAIEGAGGFLAGLRDLRVFDHGVNGTVPSGRVRQVRDGETYLVQFGRETADDFTGRVEVTTYDNHVAPVARAYQGHMRATSPVRQTTIDAVQAFWSDPDEGLGDVDAWVAVGSSAALRHGWAACLIDRPEGERPATTPGTVGRWLDPREVADWELDERGRFAWVKLISRRETRDPVAGTETETETVTIWTAAHWRRFDLREVNEQWVIEGDTGEVPHTLGRVPVALLRWVPTSRPRDLLAPSVLSGSVAAALELFNVRSELRAIERDCVFPILTVQTDDPSSVEGSKVGTRSGMTYPTNASGPAFIAPDAAVTVHYGARTEELTTRIYEAAYQERPSAQTQAPESGVSRGYRYRQMSGLLVVAAEQHEAFERDVVSILAAWDGADASVWQAATTINYPRRFDPQAPEELADTGMAVLKERAQLVPEMAAQARRMIAMALFPRLAPEDAKRLDDELAALADRDRAAFAQSQAQQTSDAAITAAVNDLPAPAPGEFVPSLAGPTAGDTTPAGA